MGHTHGIYWSEQKIIDGINQVKNILMIDRMPSQSEIQQIFRNSALTNKISKTGGFKHWADKLNLEFKESETFTGMNYEDKATEMLIDRGYSVNKMPYKHPYDLLVNDKVKIDVKVSNPYMLKTSRVHTFALNKKYATCDLYLLFALNESEEIERTFIIPSNKLKIVTLCIGKDSKYNQYLDRWDLIDKHDKFFQSLIS